MQVRFDAPGVVNIKRLLDGLLAREAVNLIGSNLETQLTNLAAVVSATDKSAIPNDVISAVKAIKTDKAGSVCRLYAAVRNLPQGLMLHIA